MTCELLDYYVYDGHENNVIVIIDTDDGQYAICSCGEHFALQY